MQGEVSGTAPYFLVMTNANCRTHSCTVFNVTLNPFLGIVLEDEERSVESFYWCGRNEVRTPSMCFSEVCAPS